MIISKKIAIIVDKSVKSSPNCEKLVTKSPKSISYYCRNVEIFKKNIFQIFFCEESFGIFSHILLSSKSINSLIVQQTCVEASHILRLKCPFFSLSLCFFGD
jgi:hypothetical protein